MKIKKHLQAFLSITVITIFLILPFLVFAQMEREAGDDVGGINQQITGTASANETLNTSGSKALGKLENIGSDGGYKTDVNLASAAGLIVKSALGLLGIIFIILIVINGFKWMMAGGEEKKVEEASHAIKRAVIGLIIILASWAIWIFISSNLLSN